jgi:hypothetical protein
MEDFYVLERNGHWFVYVDNNLYKVCDTELEADQLVVTLILNEVDADAPWIDHSDEPVPTIKYLN